MRPGLCLHLVMVLLAACGDGDSRPTPDAGPPDAGSRCMGCDLELVGSPPWLPVDMQAFVGPTGTMDTEFAEIDVFLGELYGPEHVVGASGLEVAAEHDGPYRTELSRRVDARGLATRQSFYTPELRPPTAVYVVYALVPGVGAPEGASPSNPAAPIIPNDRLPIDVDCDLHVDGALASPDHDAQIVALGRDGLSHQLVTHLIGSAFMPLGTEIEGDHELRCALTDTGSAGWTFSIPYTVMPVPETTECDHMGEHRGFDDAYAIDEGEVRGRVCDFADMYLVGGEGTRVVTLMWDPTAAGEGPLAIVNFDDSATHDVLGRNDTFGGSLRLSVPAGTFVQVYGVEGGMGSYVLRVD